MSTEKDVEEAADPKGGEKVTPASSNTITLDEIANETGDAKKKKPGQTLNEHVLDKIEAEEIAPHDDGSMPVITPEQMMAQ